MIKRVKGKTKFIWLPVKVSTTFSEGGMVAWDSGYLIEATSSTAPSTHVGPIRHAITASDSDYATARLVEVEVPVENYVIWEIDVTSGLVAADRGLYVDFTDNLTIDRSSSTYDVAQCVKVLSSTKGHFILNSGIAGCGVIGA
jgi:hypothetical protein